MDLELMLECCRFALGEDQDGRVVLDAENLLPMLNELQMFRAKITKTHGQQDSMDLENAKRIAAEIESNGGVIYVRMPNTICLDGDYTDEQLEAAIVLLRASKPS